MGFARLRRESDATVNLTSRKSTLSPVGLRGRGEKNRDKIRVKKTAHTGSRTQDSHAKFVQLYRLSYVVTVIFTDIFPL